MPTYQYACTNPDCGNRFELVQAFTDPAASACPVCEERVRKVYGSVGVVFKGSGFYRTDSRSERTGEGKPERGEGKTDKSPGDKPAEKAAAKESADSASTSAKTGSSTSAAKTPAAATAS